MGILGSTHWDKQSLPGMTPKPRGRSRKGRKQQVLAYGRLGLAVREKNKTENTVLTLGASAPQPNPEPLPTPTSLWDTQAEGRKGSFWSVITDQVSRAPS